MRGRRAVDGDDRVADELLHRPAVALEVPPERLVVAAQQRAHVLRVELLGARGRADEVDEDRRHDLPLLARPRCATSGAPQPLQNRASSGFSRAHWPQTITRRVYGPTVAGVSAGDAPCTPPRRAPDQELRVLLAPGLERQLRLGLEHADVAPLAVVLDREDVGSLLGDHRRRCGRALPAGRGSGGRRRGTARTPSTRSGSRSSSSSRRRCRPRGRRTPAPCRRRDSRVSPRRARLLRLPRRASTARAAGRSPARSPRRRPPRRRRAGRRGPGA